MCSLSTVSSSVHEVSPPAVVRLVHPVSSSPKDKRQTPLSPKQPWGRSTWAGHLNGKSIGHAKSLNYTWGFLENSVYLPKCDGKIRLHFLLDLPQKNVIFIRRFLRNSPRTNLKLIDSNINLHFGDWSSHNLQLLPIIFFISFMANIQKGEINAIW